MLTESILLGVASISLLAQVSPVALTKSTDMIPAFDSSGGVTLPAARLKIDVAYPSGRKKDGCELTVVYDPKTGYYLWHVSEPNTGVADDTGFRVKLIKSQRTIAFVDPQGLIDFSFGDGLFGKVWRGRADNLEAAISASTNEIRQGLMTFDGVGFQRDYKLVPVFGRVLGFDAKIPAGFQPISREFRCEPFNAFCPSSNNTIASISKQGNKLRLVLRNRFDVEVIVDQNLDLVSAQQVTRPRN